MNEIGNEVATAIINGDFELAADAIRNRPELRDFRSWQGETLIQFAASQGNLDIVRMINELGVDLNEKGQAESALSGMCNANNLEGVRWMLENGADANIDIWPMVHAVSAGYFDIVKLLVEHGADFDYQFGNPPRSFIQQALTFGHPEIAEFLSSRSENEAVPNSFEAEQTDSRNDDKFLNYVKSRIKGEIVGDIVEDFIGGEISVGVHTLRTKNNLVLVTKGMSEKPIGQEKAQPESQFFELMIVLPANWPPIKETSVDSAWPWIWLSRIAHFFHDNDEAFTDKIGTFAGEDPPSPLGKSTDFSAFLLMQNTIIPAFNDADKLVNVITVMPIYAEELEFAHSNSPVELAIKLGKNDLSAHCIPNRKNVAT